MNEESTAQGATRREFLKAGGVGALLLAGGGAAAGAFLQGPRPAAAVPTSHQPAIKGVVKKRFAASDGFIVLPNLPPEAQHPVTGDPALFVFGFMDVTAGTTNANTALSKATSLAKGKISNPAPLLFIGEDFELQVQLFNVGFKNRPDLTDGHTIHWHGFRNAIALFDGVPEVSIGVPAQRGFPYAYRPRDAGTYMYHCHFEDVEHVTMGMTGIVFVRPNQDGTPLGGFTKFAYNDGDGSTGYQREFALLLTDLMSTQHIGSLAVQEFVWTDFKQDYWQINSRVYPDTIRPNGPQIVTGGNPYLTALKASQPLSSLIQMNAGERGLLRFANLGYDQAAMKLDGIPMTVVGEDATLLRGAGGADLTYDTNTIYIAPGESRDALFTAPAFQAAGALSDSKGSYNRYVLKNRVYHKLTNNGQVTDGSMPGTIAGLGGQATEVRVYPAGTLGTQTSPNQTYVGPGLNQ
jgi:FtsP/CotA-like multicopper oxidase with cupredoxin domain